MFLRTRDEKYLEGPQVRQRRGGLGRRPLLRLPLALLRLGRGLGDHAGLAAAVAAAEAVGFALRRAENGVVLVPFVLVLVVVLLFLLIFFLQRQLVQVLSVQQRAHLRLLFGVVLERVGRRHKHVAVILVHVEVPAVVAVLLPLDLHRRRRHRVQAAFHAVAHFGVVAHPAPAAFPLPRLAFLFLLCFLPREFLLVDDLCDASRGFAVGGVRGGRGVVGHIGFGRATRRGGRVGTRDRD